MNFKKMIKRTSSKKYFNEELSIYSKDNKKIGININKNNNYQIRNKRKIYNLRNNNDKIEKIINLNSNENSIDEDLNEVIEIIEPVKKCDDLCQEIKFVENNNIILLSNNDDDDNKDEGIKKININKKINEKDYINSKNIRIKNNNDEFHDINKKINRFYPNNINKYNNIQQFNNNYKHQNHFKKIKNVSKYIYDKKKREKRRRRDLSITDSKLEKKIMKKNKLKKNNIQNNNIYLSPDFCLFYFLVEEYGIENVIDSIYESEKNKNSKNNIDICLQVIKHIYGENKLLAMVVQAVIFIMKNYSNKIFLKNNFNGFINQVEDKNRNIDIKNDISNKFEKINISENNEKSISIISHYNRYKDKKIYKYRIGQLLGKFVIFYCFDRKCESIGIYNLENKSFKLKKKHNLRHSQHDYIINYSKIQDNIMEEMIEKNYCDCQIFKEDQVMIVRYYS